MAWEGSAGVENFQHAQAAAVDPDTVGEGASGVDGYAERLRAARHGVDSED